MKNILVIFLLLFSHVSAAEKYVCSYFIDDEVFNESYERSGPVFVKTINDLTDSQWEIVFENDRAITLQATYAWNPAVAPISLTILIDKVKNTFIRGGLRYKVPIDVSEGTCTVVD